MIITPIKTARLTANSTTLLKLLDEVIADVPERSVLAITSKIVSLCEGSVIPFEQTDKEKLVVDESDYYLPAALSKYGHHFTITNNTLIPMAGADESNGGDMYVLWPRNAQKTANEVREYIQQKYGLKEFGVIITDSTSHPLRRGAIGIALAHSGFRALNNYVGKPDLFGRPFAVSQADIAGGLAAATVLQMGEGSESTPMAVVSDVPFITFQDRNPNDEELADMYVSLEEDLFAPFLANVQWQKGKRRASTM